MVLECVLVVAAVVVAVPGANDIEAELVMMVLLMELLVRGGTENLVEPAYSPHSHAQRFFPSSCNTNHIGALSNLDTHTHTHTHTYTHIYTHTYTHTQTHTISHTHTHIHT